MKTKPVKSRKSTQGKTALRRSLLDGFSSAQSTRPAATRCWPHLSSDKWQCLDCDWIGPGDQLDDQLTLAGDYYQPDEYENLCPVCGSDRVEEYDPIICYECDEPDCVCEAENFFEDYPEFAKEIPDVDDTNTTA